MLSFDFPDPTEQNQTADFIVQSDLRFVEGFFPESVVFAHKKEGEAFDFFSCFRILSDRYPFAPILQADENRRSDPGEDPEASDFSFLPRKLPGGRVLCYLTPGQKPLILFREEKESGVLLAFLPRLPLSEFEKALRSIDRGYLLEQLPASGQPSGEQGSDPDGVSGKEAETIRFFLIGEMISSPLSESLLTHSRRCLLVIRLSGISPDTISPSFYPPPAAPILPFLLSLLRLHAKNRGGEDKKEKKT